MAYLSRKLLPGETICKLNVEKVCLAIIWAVKVVHVYVYTYGVEFQIQTDHALSSDVAKYHEGQEPEVSEVELVPAAVQVSGVPHTRKGQCVFGLVIKTSLSLTVFVEYTKEQLTLEFVLFRILKWGNSAIWRSF